MSTPDEPNVPTGARKWSKFAKRYAVGAAGAAYAFSAGIASARHRNLIRSIAAHFGHDGGLPRRLPMVRADEVTSPLTRISLAELSGANGNVSLLELVVLARLARELSPTAMFEIGTFDGRTTRVLAMNAPAARVFTLDLPASAPTAMRIEDSERVYVDKPASGARFHNTDEEKRITQLFGDSATFDFSPYAAQLIFVDGSHAREYVLNDSIKAIEMAGGGGIIAWHDYGEWDGVTVALEHLARTDARFAAIHWVEGTTLALLRVRGA